MKVAEIKLTYKFKDSKRLVYRVLHHAYSDTLNSLYRDWCEAQETTVNGTRILRVVPVR